jgi:phosphate transport system substrate-binding protein
VKQTPGGIGYVELTYAKQNNLPVALIRNQAGAWVEPSSASTTAAIDAFHDELNKDVRTPIVDPPASAKDAYPIAGLTFLIVPKQGKNSAKTQTVKNLIQYIIVQGQDEAEKLSYAKLPTSLQQLDQNLLAQVGGESNPSSAEMR